MDEEDKAEITLSVTNNQRVVDISCICDVTLPKLDVDPVFHIADVVSGAVLDKLREFDQGKIPSGEYTLKMVAVLTPVPKEKKRAVQDPEDQ